MSDSASRNESSQDDADRDSQFAAFSRIWSDTFTRLMQLGGTFSPDSAPPEILRQMRSSVFQALSQSWEEYLRSPQFLETTKQWLDQAVNMRQMTNDYLTRLHQEMQTPARQDIDAVLLSVRHMERRVLDRLEQIEARLESVAPASAGSATGAEKKGARTKPQRPTSKK
jgi:hypothetical protein